MSRGCEPRHKHPEELYLSGKLSPFTVDAMEDAQVVKVCVEDTLYMAK